jgi:hypothetical protein
VDAQKQAHKLVPPQIIGAKKMRPARSLEHLGDIDGDGRCCLRADEQWREERDEHRNNQHYQASYGQRATREVASHPSQTSIASATSRGRRMVGIVVSRLCHLLLPPLVSSRSAARAAYSSDRVR